jgi:hypothetical protein
MMVCDSAGPEPAGGAGTSGGGRPRGDPNLAPRCGAKTRAGLGCQAPGMANGLCRIHGGTSTGPRTAEGFSRLAAAHTTDGTYTAANWIRDRYFRVLACRVRVFCAAKLLRAYLPPALAARLATTPPEFMPPVHYSNTLNSEITTKTLWSGGRDRCGTPCGSSTARSRPGPRGRAEELEAARAERQVLAPWRAAIAGARLAKREALAQRRASRIAKTRQRPYGASAAARTCSANRPEVVAAVDARLGAARLGAVAGGKAGIDATVQKPWGRSTGAGMGAAVDAPVAAGASMGGPMGGPMPRLMAGSTPIGIRIRLGVEKISVFSAFAWGRRGGGGSGDRQAGWSERTDRPTHGRRHRLPVWRPATASVGHLQQAPQGEDSRKSWQMSSISRSIIR